jgi:prophage DNA circulation protein
MSWRDEYQAGSFRGAAFRTVSHERQSGRRVAVHEMPGRDEPVVEDLGRRARQFSIECHVIGRDYRADRDALIDALEGSGPGELIHPWHGRMMVSVQDYTTSESTDDGGVCWFTLTLIEAGQPAPAPTAVAAGASAASLADSALGDAPGKFADAFSIEDAASWVEDGAAELVRGMAAASQIAAGLRGGVGPALRAFDVAFRFLPGNLSSLMRSPSNLAHAIVGLVSTVAVLSRSGSRGPGVTTFAPTASTSASSAASIQAAVAQAGTAGASARLAPLKVMLDWEPSQPVFPQRTPQRTIEATNRAALLRVFRVAVAAELVRAASTIQFASYEDARATRDLIGERLDALAIEAADAGDDETAQVYDGLRVALAADIAAQGVTLARVYALDLATTEPALVLAHRLYRADRRTDTSLEERAIGIAARNRVAHPGFLPGGTTLELLTAEPRT